MGNLQNQSAQLHDIQRAANHTDSYSQNEEFYEHEQQNADQVQHEQEDFPQPPHGLRPPSNREGVGPADEAMQAM